MKKHESVRAIRGLVETLDATQTYMHLIEDALRKDPQNQNMVEHARRSVWEAICILEDTRERLKSD